MPDTDSKPNYYELLQQILIELRDFRKECDERNTRQESAGLTAPRQLAIQTGNENAQINSNHPLPPIPLKGFDLPPGSVPEQTRLIPGQYPILAAVSQLSRWIEEINGHVFFRFAFRIFGPAKISGPANACESKTEQITSDVDPEVHTHLSDVEIATLESQHTSEIKKLKDEIEEKKQLWEEARLKNVEFSKEVAEQKTKLMKLQQIMARAGRSDNAAIDGDISTQFLQLRSDILQMVKNHLVYEPAKTQHPGVSPDFGELFLRRKVALALYNKFFSAEAMPFGFEDHLLHKNPMRNFEKTLKESRCDGTSSPRACYTPQQVKWLWMILILTTVQSP